MHYRIGDSSSSKLIKILNDNTTIIILTLWLIDLSALIKRILILYSLKLIYVYFSRRSLAFSRRIAIYVSAKRTIRMSTIAMENSNGEASSGTKLFDEDTLSQRKSDSFRGWACSWWAQKRLPGVSPPMFLWKVSRLKRWRRARYVCIYT